MDGLDADLVPKEKNTSIFQKVLGIDYDYLVKVMWRNHIRASSQSLLRLLSLVRAAALALGTESLRARQCEVIFDSRGLMSCFRVG